MCCKIARQRYALRLHDHAELGLHEGKLLHEIVDSWAVDVVEVFVGAAAVVQALELVEIEVVVIVLANIEKPRP